MGVLARLRVVLVAEADRVGEGANLLLPAGEEVPALLRAGEAVVLDVRAFWPAAISVPSRGSMLTTMTSN